MQLSFFFIFHLRSTVIFMLLLRNHSLSSTVTQSVISECIKCVSQNLGKKCDCVSKSPVI